MLGLFAFALWDFAPETSREMSWKKRDGERKNNI